MIYYGRIDSSEVIDVNKSKNSKECIVCLYWYFDNEFQFQRSVCSGWHDILMIILGINRIAVNTCKGIDYYFCFWC